MKTIERKEPDDNSGGNQKPYEQLNMRGAATKKSR